jgi:prepilin-type N-terminal cleavage/methylation domain-containing protein
VATLTEARPSRAARPGRDDDSGFSLVELVIATLLLLVVLLLATQLLLEGQLLLKRSSAEQINPVPALIAAQLRADIQTARGVGSFAPLGSYDRLELFRFPEGRLRYELVDENLERTVWDGEGNLVGTRVVAHDVRRFVWFATDSGMLLGDSGLPLLVVEVIVPMARAPRGPSLLDPLRRRTTSAQQSIVVVAAARGGGKSRGW